MQRLFLFGTLLAVVVGCDHGSDVPREFGTKSIPDAIEIEPARKVAEISDRDQELIEFILRDAPADADDRIIFLTTTPMDAWGDDGDWLSLPDLFLERIADLPVKYGRASDAILKDGTIYERSSNKQALMKWVTIKRWLSETEVEVEVGVWCCPLGGSANTILYEKVSDEWHSKRFVRGWDS